MIAIALRLLITVGVFVLIFRAVDLEGVLATFRRIEPLWLVAAVALQMSAQVIAAERWHRVMRALAYPMRRAFYLRSFFKGAFFNQGLPTSIGGDAIRVLDVAGEGHRKRDAFSGVLIDRGLGVFGLLLLNAAANLGQPGALPSEVFWALNALVAVGLLGFVAVWQFHRIAWFARQRLTYPLAVVSARLGTVLGGRGLAVQAGLSVLVHLVSMVAVFSAGRSVGLDYGLGTYLVIVPPVILLTIIPISMAGWGVREGAMIGLFTLVGADKPAVLSMSILYGVVLIAASLPGFVFYLKGRRPSPRRES